MNALVGQCINDIRPLLIGQLPASSLAWPTLLSFLSIRLHVCAGLPIKCALQPALILPIHKLWETMAALEPVTYRAGFLP